MTDVILADTSIWIDHFKSASNPFQHYLNRRAVLMHDFVLGELAVGNLADRLAALTDLRTLPRAATAHTDEVLRLVETNGLFGRGIGWVDAHLLAAIRIQPEIGLWTRDKRLFKAGQALGLSVTGLH